MALSLNSLKEKLRIKDYDSTSQKAISEPSGDHLQDLRNAINNMLIFRSQAKPGTGPEEQSGVTCTSHIVPSVLKLSLKDMDNIYISNIICAEHKDETPYCPSRTGRSVCTCNVEAYCDCYSRSGPYIPPTCSCRSRTGQYQTVCQARGSCTCLSRTGGVCSCHNRTNPCDCAQRTYVACECNNRTTSCTCNYDTVATCTCHLRTAYCNCQSRTAEGPCSSQVYQGCDCEKRITCTCLSRTETVIN